MVADAAQRHESDLPPLATWSRRTYFLVLVAIFVFQGTLAIHDTVLSYIFTNSNWAEPIPISFLWAFVDIQGVAWLLLVPIMAWFIVRYRASVIAIICWNCMFFLFVVVVFHFVVTPVEIAQMDGWIETRPSHHKTFRTQESDEEQVATARTQEKTLSYWVEMWLLEISINLWTYAPMSAIGYAVFYFQLNEQRTRQAEWLQKSLVEAQHATLCSRLQPHFLFNTLNAIGSLTISDPPLARECIGQLGELLRKSLDSLPEKEIPLSDEIEILENFLNIQKARFGEQLDYEIKVANEVANSMIPAFLLQPIVENSFKHGFSKKNGNAIVRVSARKLAGKYQVEIIDNGSFVESGEWRENEGIELTRKRLNLHYEDQASVTFEACQPSGLKVTILIPNGE